MKRDIRPRHQPPSRIPQQVFTAIFRLRSPWRPPHPSPLPVPNPKMTGLSTLGAQLDKPVLLKVISLLCPTTLASPKAWNSSQTSVSL